jgi:hypothetical protein
VQDGIHSRLRNWESFNCGREIGACAGEDAALASAEAGAPPCKGWIFTRGSPWVMGHALVLYASLPYSRTSPVKGRAHVPGLI